MGYVITVANEKGGVAKTTTALNLASAWAMQGMHILLIDLDPSGSLTAQVETQTADLPLAGGWLQQEQNLIKPANRIMTNMDMIGSSRQLHTIEKQLYTPKGTKCGLLERKLRTLRNHYHYIVIDTYPMYGALLLNALVAADMLISPVKADFGALQGVNSFLDAVRTVEKYREPVDFVMVPIMYSANSQCQVQILDLLAERVLYRMSQTKITADEVVMKAAAEGKVIVKDYPETAPAQDYQTLAEEINEKFEQLSQVGK